MKRIYACILIVAALLGVSLYSSGRVQGFAQDISADLDCALEAVRQKDFPTARQALAEGAELCDTMRETMSHLLRTADYTELEAALRAADGYLEQQAAEEALGELRRARWLLREPGSGTREAVEQALLPHLRGFAQTLQLGNTEAIKQAAIAGLGLACLSRHALEEPLALGRLRVLETPLPALQRTLWLVRHPGKQWLPGLQALLGDVE